MIEPIYIPFKDTVLEKGDLFRLRTKGKIIASVAIHSNILVSLLQITKEVDAFVIRLSHST